MKLVTCLTLCIVLFCWQNVLLAQTWTWEEKAAMPVPVSNNAVAAATVGGVPYVFSFAGIDTTKVHSGIHLNSFRYNTQSDSWETISPLPDSLGKIAAGASTVKNKIYIIGGYHVFSGGSELSSDKVHIYNPETNSYEPDGAPIPIAIDDQVQAVWRDSLIYVVTGWSDVTNVNAVQIYDPANDQWLEGTSTPNNTLYRVFGGSGEIIGDTIYYMGGARSTFNFPLGMYFRKGIINPNDPTEITWTEALEPLSLGYRMGTSTYGEKVFWFGGSLESYNYNGLAYTNGQGVDATERIVTYDAALQTLAEEDMVIPPVMDLRGVGKIASNQYIIAGGMGENQKVSARTYLVTYNDVNAVDEMENKSYEFVVSPEKIALHLFNQPPQGTVQLFSLDGKVLGHDRINGKAVSMNVAAFPPGIYFLEIAFEDGSRVVEKWVRP